MKTVAQFMSFLGFDKEGGGKNSQHSFQHPIRELNIDSRQIQAGDCFIALQGECSHGLAFLDSVLLKLAEQPALILMDQAPTVAQQAQLAQYPHVVWRVVEGLTKRLAELASWFYDQPSCRIKVVGITGTNGKTSTAFYTAQLLNELGFSTALMGTLGNGVFKQGQLDALASTLNTTPDVVTVQRLLATFVAKKIDYVVMEVSSHALVVGRVAGVVFDVVALTQVTRDHLDFHGSIESYHQAKQTLFTDYSARINVVNAGDAVGQKIIKRLARKEKGGSLWRYAIQTNRTQHNTDATLAVLPELLCDSLQLTPKGMSLSLRVCALRGGGEEIQDTVFVPLLGAFNAENFVCALSIILASHSESDRAECWSKLKLQLPQLQAVKGRMQPVALSSNSPTVIVDFAHSPDALQQVLLAAKRHIEPSSGGKLWVVFGCGGDRDQGKRSLMATISESFSDHVMVTSDNPRFEAIEQIMAQIMTGFKAPNDILVEPDRAKAIQQVLALSGAEDVILIAGKGHENYQEIKGIKTPFQDEKVVLDLTRILR